MKVPSLEDVFEFMEGKFVRLNLDLKTSGTDRNYAENLYELMVEYDMTDRCVITSSDYEILKEIKIIDDDIKTGYILSMAVGKNYNMKYVDNRITANAPQCGSFKIPSFFSASP